ncbi:major facilitator superfamily transporter [Nitzschia inconspicua]|uniref:Major facilitator superfamily transporter n=1 Tax=Nitzschia inconspicua TaxID=303405 RepID=A0A9K3LQD9_9STRA|nr:major facilitator superfamily transporter [Nitzschia inconspicua]
MASTTIGSDAYDASASPTQQTSIKDLYRLKFRSSTLYILSFTLTSLVAGLVYGWPALRQQLLVEGSTLSESQLGIIFTVGSWSTQGCRFFVGLARDRFGTQSMIVCSMILVTVGCVGIGLSDPDNVAALASSLFLVGLGSGVQLCTQPVASLFPNRVGITLSSLSGAFQISGLIFLALTSGTRPRRFSFLFYSGGLVVLTVVAALLYPSSKSFLLEDDAEQKETHEQKNSSGLTKSSIDGESELVEPSVPICERLSESKDTVSSMSETYDCSGTTTTTLKKQEEGLVPTKVVADDTSLVSDRRDESDSQDKEETSFTAFEQIKTSEYILLCLWFSVCLVPMQYYVATIGFQLEERGDDSGFYTDLFAYTYAGATVTAPMAGFLADQFGLGVSQGVGTGLVAFSLFLLSSQEIGLEWQSIGLVAYGIGRMAIFGIYFTNCGMRFGYSNFGTLAGLGLLTSALFSLLQYPLIDSASKGNSSLINLILGIILVVQTPYFIWLFVRERKYESANSVTNRIVEE